LAGGDLAPPDLMLAPARLRKAFWSQVAVLARDQKYRELKAGIGVDGQRLPPRKRRRHDRARGPVLVPHWNDSRFITMLRWEATTSGAVLWWRFPWGKIVAYHAQGIRGVVRNVVGLSAESVDRVRERAAKWWAGNRDRVETPAERQFIEMPTPPPGVRYREYAAFDTGYRKPPPRPSGSIFRPRPGPGFQPVRPATITTRQTPWEFQRTWADFMDQAFRKELTEGEIDALVQRVGDTQSLGTVRDTLRRLGVTEPIPDWATALDLLRRQLLDRLRGRFPGVWRPEPPLGGSAPFGRNGGPRSPLRTAARVGVGLGLAYAVGELIRAAVGGSE
jgi:hypothetical protein